MEGSANNQHSSKMAELLCPRRARSGGEDAASLAGETPALLNAHDSVELSFER
jgi:hypothetical protein